MPTVMTHAVVAVGLGKLFTSRRMHLYFWVMLAGLAALPDIDTLAQRFGIAYTDPFGHRGFTHSLLFALGVAVLATLCSYRYFKVPALDLCGFLFVVVASHGILDAFTDGGEGVAFFWPYNRRYFMPDELRVIRVSQIGLRFFSGGGMTTLASEGMWICLPTVVVAGSVMARRRWVSRRRDNAAAHRH